MRWEAIQTNRTPNDVEALTLDLVTRTRGICNSNKFWLLSALNASERITGLAHPLHHSRQTHVYNDLLLLLLLLTTMVVTVAVRPKFTLTRAGMGTMTKYGQTTKINFGRLDCLASATRSTKSFSILIWLLSLSVLIAFGQTCVSIVLAVVAVNVKEMSRRIPKIEQLLCEFYPPRSTRLNSVGPKEICIFGEVFFFFVLFDSLHSTLNSAKNKNRID